MGNAFGNIYDGLTFGLYSTFIITLGFMLLGKMPTIIQPAEVVVWSWKNLQRRSGQCLGGGIILCLVLWLFFLPDFAMPQALLMGLLFGGGFVCIFALAFAGLSNEVLDKQCHVTPNQGIHRSIRNSLFLGGMNASIAGLFVSLIFLLFGYSVNAMVVYGVIFGISTFLVTGLRTGGYAWIQHILLRALLWKTHNAPLNYPEFPGLCGRTHSVTSSWWRLPLYSSYFARLLCPPGSFTIYGNLKNSRSARRHLSFNRPFQPD